MHVKDADAATDAGTREFRLAQLTTGLALTTSPPADAVVVDTAGLDAEGAARALLAAIGPEM